MKDEKERRKHVLTVVAIVGGGGVILFVLANAARGGSASTPRAATPPPSRSRSPSARVGVHSLNFGPNPAQPALDTAIVNARASAINTYDQSSVAERSAEEQYLLGLNETAAAKAVAFNTNATQLKETGMTTTAAQTIAQEEAAAQQAVAQAQAQAYEQVGSQYASAAQTQASGSWWQSILGGIGSILPFLGL